VDYAVKLDKGITETFSPNVGVKQGCVLSPTLFNLYLHDLPSKFDSSCEPVKLGNTKLSCLMLADDIAFNIRDSGWPSKCPSKDPKIL